MSEEKCRLQTYALPCGWKISIPDYWQGEYDEDDGQCVFYPDNSDLTIRITPFHAERDGILAPVKVMESAYINTIPEAARTRDAQSYALDGFEARMYESTGRQENKTVYTIHIGYYAIGELLSINIFSTNKTECERALDILKTIKR